jgi:molecular chaperone DnaJ
MLSDEQRRAMYDQFGVTEGGVGGPGPGSSGVHGFGFEGFPGGSPFDFGNGVKDPFESLFRGMGMKSRRGTDIQASTASQIGRFSKEI